MTDSTGVHVRILLGGGEVCPHCGGARPRGCRSAPHLPHAHGEVRGRKNRNRGIRREDPLPWLCGIARFRFGEQDAETDAGWWAWKCFQWTTDKARLHLWVRARKGAASLLRGSVKTCITQCLSKRV